MGIIEAKVAKTAKRAGLLSGGLLLCAVGAAFLTAAGWLALLPLVGLVQTALIIAGMYLGAGLICIGLGSRSDRSENGDQPAGQASHAAPLGEGPPIMQAFLFGMQAGAQADQSRRSAS